MAKVLIETKAGNFIKQTNTSVNNTINSLYQSLNDEEIKFLFLEDVFIPKNTIITVQIMEETHSSDVIKINKHFKQNYGSTI